MMYLLLILGLFALFEVSRGSLASLSAVILLMVRVGAVGQNLQGAQQGLRQSLPFIERLQETAKRYANAVPVTGDAPLASVEEIEFDDVSFGYRPERLVLHEISCAVSTTEAIGVIGPSGAGKSTFVQLLLALREPTSGEYLVNGQPASSFAREDWHRVFAYVPQEPKLLHDTVSENIRFRREGISDEDVRRAARLAHIDEVIAGWSDGYDTVIGPRADAISGGQQQRICLARALVQQPSVLVLDEPTSALDPQSEAAIQDTLRELKGELTVFIVAHRMSTLDVCDRVMVILDGRLAAFEPVDVLQRESAYYRRATAIAASGGGALP
jgi:ABC-type multidrug transport system fused ATPase/permease subunit